MPPHNPGASGTGAAAASSGSSLPSYPVGFSRATDRRARAKIPHPGRAPQVTRHDHLPPFRVLAAPRSRPACSVGRPLAPHRVLDESGEREVQMRVGGNDITRVEHVMSADEIADIAAGFANEQ